MTRRTTEALITTLAADLRPIRPLASPLRRAIAILALMTSIAGVAIIASPNTRAVLAIHAVRTQWLALEMLAVLATGVLAIIAAFTLSVPGRSRGWLIVPLAPMTFWIGVAGWGCYFDALTGAAAGSSDPPSLKCLAILFAASLVLAPPVVWSLSRALPLDLTAVAMSAGLGVAAFAAFILYFFHPHVVTAFDLAAHLFGAGLIVTAIVQARRRLFAPA